MKNTVSAGYFWWPTDSARTPANPSTTYLLLSLAMAETVTAAENGQVNLWSNGFGAAGGAASTINTAENNIYAAFAENPFGGENTAPATAR